MFASVRIYKVNNPREFSEKVNSGFVDIISKAKGFVSYNAVEGADGSWVSISIFRDKDGIEESNRIASDFVKENLASMVSETMHNISGPVVASSK